MPLARPQFSALLGHRRSTARLTRTAAHLLDDPATTDEPMSTTGDAVEKDKRQRRPGPPPRFTSRLVICEEPDVIRQLEEQAASSGVSVASEIRQAVRWWLKASE
jgi:hypothetical protein